MNDILRPVTADGLVGFDQYNQLFAWRVDKNGERRVGRIIADVREKTCVICARGWDLTSDSLCDQTSWSLTESYVHETCLVRHCGLVERARFEHALVHACVRFSGLVDLPNRYFGKPTPENPWGGKPWYSAQLLDHPVRFVLGRRKHVDHVEVVPNDDGGLGWWERARDIFKDEDVTMWFGPEACGLHAYTEEKVRTYVSTLADIGGLKHGG